MHLKKTIALLFLFSLGLNNFVFGQNRNRSEGFKENHSPFGRRKKEKSNQKFFSKRAGGGIFRLFGRSSKGNSESFANNRIIGRKGFFASAFRSKHSGNASLRRTKSAKKDDKNLFKRNRTNSKISFRKKQDRQGRRRERTRKRGNVLFSKRKR